MALGEEAGRTLPRSLWRELGSAHIWILELLFHAASSWPFVLGAIGNYFGVSRPSLG